MNRLKELAKKAKGLRVNKILVNVYSEFYTEQFIIDLNRYDQLLVGKVGVDNDYIGFYSRATEAINPTKREGEPFTLNDTGQFYKTFEIKVNKDGSFNILADGQKESILAGGKIKKEDILDKYDNVLGLTPESLQKLRQFILPEFIKEVRKELLF